VSAANRDVPAVGTGQSRPAAPARSVGVGEAGATTRAIPDDVIRLPLTDPSWRVFCSTHPDALAFHRPGWAELLAECYRYRAFALATLDTRGEIAGGLPIIEVRTLMGRKWISLPFTDSCPPLLAPGVGADRFAEQLQSEQSTARIRSFQIRTDVSTPGALRHGDAVTHALALRPDPDQLVAGFRQSQVRRNIRRAEREGVVVRRGESPADLVDTYYALHVQTRRRLGSPAQPRRFFMGLWRHLLEPGHGRLLLAYTGSRPIAGAVFLTGRGTVTYKYGASDADFWSLRPNHLLFWQAICWACEAGFHTLDFGRSDTSDHGLRNFKSAWGADEAPLVYTTLSDRNLGDRFATAATSRLLRRLPPWVCRVAGEVFYRYAA
jgi:CelD/BcsL family acetyltransferase involved in cellulose biosynthesis